MKRIIILFLLCFICFSAFSFEPEVSFELVTFGIGGTYTFNDSFNGNLNLDIGSMYLGLNRFIVLEFNGYNYLNNGYEIYGFLKTRIYYSIFWTGAPKDEFLGPYICIQPHIDGVIYSAGLRLVLFPLDVDLGYRYNKNHDIFILFNMTFRTLFGVILLPFF